MWDPSHSCNKLKVHFQIFVHEDFHKSKLIDQQPSHHKSISFEDKFEIDMTYCS